MLTLPHRHAATPLHAHDLRWELEGGAPWPESSATIDAAIQALPRIDDPLAAALIVELLHTIVQLRERGRSIEHLVSTGLCAWHRRYLADSRRQRLRDERRRDRREAAV